MKQTILPALLLLLFTYVSQAKSFTVSNRPGSPAQYVKISDAITAASAGDTIYILGSETMYDNIGPLYKKIVFIGPGHNPNKQTPLKATINAIYVNQQANNISGSGSTFIGLTVNAIQCADVNDITIKRCKIDSYIQLTNFGKDWTIENNIINYIYINSGVNPDNFIIAHNVIQGSIRGTNSSLIANNIFINSTNNNQPAFIAVKNSNILNNIFYEVSPEGAENSIFTNNISYSNKATAIPYGTNSGLNNKIDVDPKFTKFPAEGDRFKYEYDFRLQASSPGKNAGNDGKDIGIYGGTGFSETGEPPVPHVREFAIINGVVAPNGKLSISIKAEAKN